MPMIEDEKVKRVIRLLRHHVNNLSPDLTKFLDNDSDIFISNFVLLDKAKAYEIYKMRAYNISAAGRPIIFGYEQLLANIEKSSLERILVVGVDLTGHTPILIFCDEELSELVGVIRAEH